ncbi:MAG: prokaryotic E2 ligase family D protein [Chloroflexota bacterium]|nr:prokaryotic E2 ligase family D protein [Chloroflexota bacterium]
MATNPTHAALITALLTPGPRALGALEAELLMYEGQYLFHYRQNAADHYKLLTADTVAVAFTGLGHDSGWLPPGLVRSGVTAGGPFAVLFQPPAIHTLPIILGDNGAPQALTIPLPGLVLAGHETNWYIWAVQEAVFTPTALVYATPLPNVYPDGGICWGENPVPPVGPGTMQAALDLFLHSPFNSHIAGGRIQTAQRDVRPFLRKLARAKATTFPATELLPFNSHPTIDRALERILQDR